MQRVFLIGLGLILSSPVYADSLAAFKTCASVADDAARLACFDREMIAIDAVAAQAAKDRTIASLAKAKADAAKAEADHLAEAERTLKAKKESFGAEQLPAVQRSKDLSEVKQLDATIVEVLTNSLGDFTLVLDNGQMWKQMESATLPPIRNGDAVRIKKGLISGFRVTFLKMGRTVSVQRFR